MSNPIDGLLTKEQTDLIFENMSDGAPDGQRRRYHYIYEFSLCQAPSCLCTGCDPQLLTDLFLQNKKNRAFNKLFKNSMEKGQLTDKTTVKYTPTDVKDSLPI